MEKILLLLLVISTCVAHDDLSGKVLVFPKETNSHHVKLRTPKAQFYNATVCLRFVTDQKRTFSLFSLATPTQGNAFLIYKSQPDVISLYVKDASADFLSLSVLPNTWHSLCATWRSDNGVAQMWLDGKPTVKRHVASGHISGNPITILGQEQDTYGGGFDAAQSFLGMISQVHMWDYVLPPTEVKRYMSGKHFTSGNVFNWRSLEFEITGQIFVDDDA